MIVSSNIKKIHEEIRKNIFIMLPEKWDKLYLYASIVDDINSKYTGEMFLYYFPKGILKKNPVNIYEVPNKFNIDENQYLELVNNLYNSIRKLRRACIQDGEKIWSNITISIEGLVYKAEYNYDDIQNSEFTNEERRIIWMFKYLQKPFESYTKYERQTIKRFLYSEERRKSITTIYQDNIYDRPVSTLIGYNKESENYVKRENSTIYNEKQKRESTQAFKSTEEKDNILKKNQILNN